MVLQRMRPADLAVMWMSIEDALKRPQGDRLLASVSRALAAIRRAERSALALKEAWPLWVACREPVAVQPRVVPLLVPEVQLPSEAVVVLEGLRQLAV